MSPQRRLLSFVNRLAVRISLPVAIAGTLGPVWAGLSVLWSLLIGVGCVAVSYAAAHVLLHYRLERGAAALRRIRRHEFDGLSGSQPVHDELGRLLREIHRTGQKVETEIEELKEMESYRREFLGNVSHELKTPIFSVQGFTETLLDGAMEDEAVNRTFLEKIRHNVNRLEALARDLSAITEIETGEMDMTIERVDVPQIVDDVIHSVELKADQKDVTLRQELADALPSVFGDPARIRRVLVNLIDNAIKYNEPGGTVVVRAAAPSSGEVELEVVDDGIGIADEHLPRLTERFYRVDKSRSRNQGGTGLGLAIVKHNLAAHDRDLHVESTPEEGSTFRFTLPTARPSSLS